MASKKSPVDTSDDAAAKPPPQLKEEESLSTADLARKAGAQTTQTQDSDSSSFSRMRDILYASTNPTDANQSLAHMSQQGKSDQPAPTSDQEKAAFAAAQQAMGEGTDAIVPEPQRTIRDEQVPTTRLERAELGYSRPGAIRVHGPSADRDESESSAYSQGPEQRPDVEHVIVPEATVVTETETVVTQPSHNMEKPQLIEAAALTEPTERDGVVISKKRMPLYIGIVCLLVVGLIVAIVLATLMSSDGKDNSGSDPQLAGVSPTTTNPPTLVPTLAPTNAEGNGANLTASPVFEATKSNSTSTAMTDPPTDTPESPKTNVPTQPPTTRPTLTPTPQPTREPTMNLIPGTIDDEETPEPVDKEETPEPVDKEETPEPVDEEEILEPVDDEETVDEEETPEPVDDEDEEESLEPIDDEPTDESLFEDD